jgi:hypothetical protein
MSDLLNIAIEHQQHDQWCWAAVTQAVCRAFGDATATQASIVCQVLANPLCGSMPTPASCNVQFPVDVSLDQYNHLDDRPGLLSFAQVQQQIDLRQRPIAILVQFAVTGGVINHACLIKGWEMVGGVPHLTLLDPSPVSGTESHVAYDDLLSGLALGGRWMDSFTVR